MAAVESLRWEGEEDGYLRLLDQTKLPLQLEYLDCRGVEQVWEAIKSLRVRGAPAIGIAAAYGLCLGLANETHASTAAAREALAGLQTYLASSRPTAVNLRWALERMLARASTIPDSVETKSFRAMLLEEARAIHDLDRRVCHAIGAAGASLISDGQSLLTHCNTGGLATSEYGTALSIFFTAQDQGKNLHVFVDETRPLLQGARLTAWELMRREIPATLICDSMAAQVMREGRVQGVFVGADRIAVNGDTANKIGTYGLAVLARAHAIPFYVAAPSSSFDRRLPDGAAIPIEQRGAEEITEAFGTRTAPQGVAVYNPAFDVTPGELITGIITEQGILRPPYLFRGEQPSR